MNRRPLRVRAALVAGALLLSAAAMACIDLLTVGFGAPKMVAVGDTVEGTIGSGSSITFGVKSSRHQDVALFAQALRPKKFGDFDVSMADPVAWAAPVTLPSSAEDTALYDLASRKVHFVSGGTYAVVVTSTGYAGRFRFQVFGYGNDTEGPDVIGVGDTAVGSIDPPGDVDVHLLASPADGSIIVSFQRLDPATDMRLHYAVEYRGTSTVIVEGIDNGGTPESETHYLPPVPMAAGDTLAIVVEGLRPTVDTGAYRLIPLLLVAARSGSH